MVPACAGTTTFCGGGRPGASVIPGRSQRERTRNLEIPGLVLRTIPE
jgi:hypothetical protein